MRKNFKKEVTVEEVCRRYREGESISQLEESLGACSWTIADRLKRGGVATRTNTQNAGITPEMEAGMVVAYVGGKGSTIAGRLRRKWSLDRVFSF